MASRPRAHPTAGDRQALDRPAADDRTGEPARLLLDRFTPYRLNRISEAVSLRFSTVYKERHGLTRPEWRALAALGELETMTATAIGRHSAMHKTKVSRAIAGLEERKWVRRDTDPKDRRVEHLALTRAGRTVYAELSAVALNYERDLKAILGDDAAQALEAALSALEMHFCGGPVRDPGD